MSLEIALIEAGFLVLCLACRIVIFNTIPGYLKALKVLSLSKANMLPVGGSTLGSHADARLAWRDACIGTFTPFSSLKEWC